MRREIVSGEQAHLDKKVQSMLLLEVSLLICINARYTSWVRALIWYNEKVFGSWNLFSAASVVLLKAKLAHENIIWEKPHINNNMWSCHQSQQSKMDYLLSVLRKLRKTLEYVKNNEKRRVIWRSGKTIVLTRVGFEPTPMKTTALTLRLRPLGHRVELLTSLVVSKVTIIHLR